MSAAESDFQFVHEPLEDPRSQIRLLRLSDFDSESELEITIRHVSLNNDAGTPVQYHALSYTWGDTRDLETIRVNGRPFKIRQNLFLFLATAQLQELRHDLWIDQLSIDQNQRTERNEQVAIMAEIYSKAAKVIVWLGYGLEMEEAVLTDIRDLAELPRSLDLSTNQFTNPPVGQHGLQFELLLKLLGSNLLSLFENPYWSRLWIIQELVMAREIELQAGDVRISWSHFHAIRDHFGKQRTIMSATDDFPRDEQMSERPGRVTQLPENIEYLVGIAMTGRSHAPLFDILQRFCHAECEDPRDKFYGLLAIIDLDAAIPVDYNKSTAEVYLDVVSAIVRQIKPSDTEYYDAFVRLRFICNELLENMTQQSSPGLWDHICEKFCRGHGQARFHEAIRGGSHVDRVMSTLKQYLGLQLP